MVYAPWLRKQNTTLKTMHGEKERGRGEWQWTGPGPATCRSLAEASSRLIRNTALLVWCNKWGRMHITNTTTIVLVTKSILIRQSAQQCWLTQSRQQWRFAQTSSVSCCTNRSPTFCPLYGTYLAVAPSHLFLVMCDNFTIIIYEHTIAAIRFESLLNRVESTMQHIQLKMKQFLYIEGKVILWPSTHILVYSIGLVQWCHSYACD